MHDLHNTFLFSLLPLIHFLLMFSSLSPPPSVSPENILLHTQPSSLPTLQHISLAPIQSIRKDLGGGETLGW